jgi:hypothetical protein
MTRGGAGIRVAPLILMTYFLIIGTCLSHFGFGFFSSTGM